MRQLESAMRAFTCRLAAHTGLVPTGDEVVFVDIDSKVKPVYGPAKQGTSFGYTKQRGLHFQIVTVKTSTYAPVIVATRLRKGSAKSGKGCASLLREAMATVRTMGITAQIIVRADSAHFSHKVVAACRAHGARFSLAVAVKKKIRQAIAAIADDAWTPIQYTTSVWDAEEKRWISDAEIAEAPFTAFTSEKKASRHGPAHRAPRQAPEPRVRARGAERAVQCLAGASPRPCTCSGSSTRSTTPTGAR
nr:transposase [Streptomyces sp. NBC_01450]